MGDEGVTELSKLELRDRIYARPDDDLRDSSLAEVLQRSVPDGAASATDRAEGRQRPLIRRCSLTSIEHARDPGDAYYRHEMGL